MELTIEKQTIFMLSLELRIEELEKRIKCFEEAVAEGVEKYKETLHRTQADLKRTLMLYEEVRVIQ